MLTLFVHCALQHHLCAALWRDLDAQQAQLKAVCEQQQQQEQQQTQQQLSAASVTVAIGGGGGQRTKTGAARYACRRFCVCRLRLVWCLWLVSNRACVQCVSEMRPPQ
jgi:hypothetical protein